MENQKIPHLSEKIFIEMLDQAKKSIRHRYSHVLHKPGAEFNRVFNLMQKKSYMQPHLHPGEEKIEKIYIIKGSVCCFFFDDNGKVTNKIDLKTDGKKIISVPAFTWHTYAITSDVAVTYETMMGKYNPSTWKKFAEWAPKEQSEEANNFLKKLHEIALN